MKRQLLAFFFIALLAEMITNWLQQFRADSILGSGIYYANLRALFMNRLLYWLVIYLLLSVLWLLISRNYQKP